MPEDIDAQVVLGVEATEVIGRCLSAWADGPFIDDWEFQTVTGLDRDEVRSVRDTWPMITDLPLADHAVRAALGQLLGYPHGLSLEEHAGVSDAQVRAARSAWCSTEL